MNKLLKKEIRKNMLEDKKNLSKETVERKSLAIFNTLKKTDYYKNANNIMIYVTLGNEVITEPIIHDLMSKGKKVFVPLTVPKTKALIASELKDFEKDLEIGHFGVREPTKEATRPVEPSILDLIIVPGVAFDRKGYRVGYGAGYYDRFLLRISEKARTIALAFHMQLIDKVPVDDHDIAVEHIITEKEFIKNIRNRA